MGVSPSEDRHRSLTTTLGEKSEFEPQRRADIDMIFLGARGQDARALIPQLLFNRAGGLPIYATALISDGKPSAAVDGLRFRSEEPTSELQSLMRHSYAVFS